VAKNLRKNRGLVFAALRAAGPDLTDRFEQRERDRIGYKLIDTNLKLARMPARSPLPIAALPSMSLIPSAPFT